MRIYDSCAVNSSESGEIIAAFGIVVMTSFTVMKSFSNSNKLSIKARNCRFRTFYHDVRDGQAIPYTRMNKGLSNFQSRGINGNIFSGDLFCANFLLPSKLKTLG